MTSNIYIHRMFRNLWDPLRELTVRLEIMKKSHINICPICLRLRDTINFINRANSSKLVLYRDGIFNFHNNHNWDGGNPHVIVHSRHQHQFSWNVRAGIIDKFLIGPFSLDGKLTDTKYVDFSSTRLHEISEQVPVDVRLFVCGLRRVLAEWLGNF